MHRTSSKWYVDDFSSEKNGTYVLKLRRLTGTIIATTVLPVIFFNFLIDLVFLLPPASGERVGFSVTLVLTFSVLLMGVGNIIPTSADGPVTLGEMLLLLETSIS